MYERKTYGVNYPGIRYREHSKRLHAGRPDRCFLIRHKKREGRVGWARDGWSARKAADILGIIRCSQLTTSPLAVKAKPGCARCSAALTAAVGCRLGWLGV